MPALVNQLDSDDPVVRLAAIRTLERFTGTTLGYEHADPPWERDQAIGRWRRYLATGAPEAAAQPPSPARDASAATAGSGRP